jgi:hypothetical protein
LGEYAYISGQICLKTQWNELQPNKLKRELTREADEEDGGDEQAKFGDPHAPFRSGLKRGFENYTHLVESLLRLTVSPLI